MDYQPERILAQISDAGEFNVGDDLVESLLYTKYKHWAYEEELRAYVDLDPAKREEGRYYYEFSNQLIPREVILGPLCEIPIKSVRLLVGGFQPRVYVKKGRLAFKFYKVVEDERYRC